MNLFHRPQYHFMPPANWMNDPNGLIQWRGRYHMFYQHYPYGAYWSTMYWGHAVSDDLVHWEHLPIALTPTPGGPDQDGCWSGCAVNRDGVPTLIYTGVRPQVQCLATAEDDNLWTWRKHPANPIIAALPPGLGLSDDFRDPCVWREGETWYMVVGSSVRDVGGIILLYRSADLIHWDFVQPILVGDKNQREPLPTGTMWECPSFFPLGDRYVLIVSAMGMEDGSRYTVYFGGEYRDFTFKPDILQLLDYGQQQFYAPQTFVDDQGRRLMFGWLPEDHSPEAQQKAGWSGVMSLPRVLSMRPDGTLGMVPAAEVERLHGAHRQWSNVALTADAPTCDLGTGRELDIVARFTPDSIGQFGLEVCCSPDGVEQTRVVYDTAARRLTLDTTRSSLSDEVGRRQYDGELIPEQGEGLELRVLVDRSVIEVYANGRVCISGRVYPTRPDSQAVRLFADGRAAASVDVWEMPGGPS